MEEKRIIAYKGFDENLCCKGFQYEIGKEYEQEGEIECCRSGFHACINPFDVLNYYNANGKNRFCEVEQKGIIRTDSYGTKQASSKIKIKAEIGISGLFKAGVEWIKEKTNPITIIKDIEGNRDNPNSESIQTGLNDCNAKVDSSSDYAQISSIGYYDHISSSGNSTKIGSSSNSAQICSSGDSTQIGSIGNYTKISSSGNHSQIGSSGYYTKISSSGNSTYIGSSGYYTKIDSSGNSTKIGSSGDSAQICSSGDSALIGSIGDYTKINSNGCNAQISSSGYYTKINSSGDFAQIGSIGDSTQISSSGYSTQINSTGEYSVICCAGNKSRVKAKIGSWVTLSEWKYSEEKKRNIPVCVKTEYVDGKRIKEDTWYQLINGEFTEI